MSSDSPSMITLPSRNERTWAMLSHMIACAVFVLPFGNIVGPLTIWLVKKKNSPFVDDQGKESVNFQITMTLAMLVATLLTFILVGYVLFPIVFVVGVVFVIIAAAKANEGTAYRYPFAIRFIK